MSFQIAMMAGMAAMSVAQAAQSASKAGAASGRQIASLHEAERQNAIEANIAKSETAIQKMGYEVQGANYLTQAAQTDVTAAEIGIATKQQELMRRRELGRLGQANAIDLVARGGVPTGQDSAGAIDEYNREMCRGGCRQHPHDGRQPPAPAQLPQVQPAVRRHGRNPALALCRA